MSWSVVAIQDIAEVNPRAPKDLEQKTLVSFVPMSATSEQGQLISDTLIHYDEVKKGLTYFSNTDVLIAKITPCFENGKSLRPYQISENIGFGSTEFHVIRANQNKVIPEYLFYILWSKNFRELGEQAMTGAAGQKRISTDFLKKFKIPLPPLEEQRRIASILDKADAIRQKRQQAIAKLDELLQATFIDMFGDPVSNPKKWIVDKLGSHIVHANNGLSRRRKESENIGHIVLRLQDVQYSGIDFEKELNRIELDQSEQDRFRVDKGDILFIRVNGNPDYVGRSAVFESYKEPVFHNDHLIRIKVDENYNPTFLSYCLNHKGGKKIISQQLKTSAGQHTISQSGLEALEFYVPPIELQNKFEKLLNHAKSIPFEQNKLDTLFNALQHKAFNGTL